MSGGLNLPASLDAGLKILRAMPVELRRRDFALVDRTTIGLIEESVRRLEAGTYVVGVTLPTGTSLSQEFTVDQDGSINYRDLLQRFVTAPSVIAFLDRHGAPAVAARVRTWTSDLVEQVAESVPVLRQTLDWAASLESDVPVFGAEAPSEARWALRVRLFEMESSGFHLASAARLRTERDDAQGTIKVRAPREQRTGLLQFVREGAPALNVVLPPGATVTVSISENDDIPTILTNIEVGVDIVDDMLKMRSDGRLSDITTLVSSLDHAEIDHYLDRTPGAAYAFCYAILRAGNRDLAESAVRELQARQRPEPDAAIIIGELAALQGRHADALRAFISAGSDVLPIFSYGLNYLIDRLRFYVQGTAQSVQVLSLGLSEVEISTTIKVLERLQPFGLFADYEQPLLTFTGLDPADPDDDITSPEAVSALANARIILRAHGVVTQEGNPDDAPPPAMSF